MQQSIHLVRQAPKLERRAEGAAPVIVGFIPYYSASDAGTEFELWDNTFERLMPGCFQNAVAERDDVRGLFNHNPSYLLGRLSAETVRLFAEAGGLRYEIDPPDTQAGRDTVALLERGDLDQSSFAFSTWRKRGRVVWVEEADRTIREIHDLELHDVSPVTEAAYSSATSGLRSKAAERIKAEYQQWQQQRRSQPVPADRRRLEMRLRLLELEENSATT